MPTRTCRECQREFTPSSGHLSCPICRFAVNGYDVCTCGLPKQKKSALCTLCVTRAGATNANWKGGRTRHRKGYVMIRWPEHPRARSAGYVFEHILVLESVLGRPLHPHESVHHVNGVKDDNRPENLELWTRPQPSGIRASDAIAWAHEILARYEREGPSPTSFSEPFSLNDLGDGGNRTPVDRC
jgi:hypothetical protein